MRDPVKVACDLRRLHAACHAARGKERKARAIYALAAYYRNQGTLVLYNNSLWRGFRVHGFWYWNEDVESAADRAAWRKHCYEHESYARARALCLEILRRYPRTRVAARAAYTAGICCYRLCDFNDWWRAEDRRAHLGAQAVRLMKMVVKRYPRSELRRAAQKYAGVYYDELLSLPEDYGRQKPERKTNSANLHRG